MSDPIISREQIRQGARDAFNRNEPRDSHNMNWHALALADWLEGWDGAAAAELARQLTQSDLMSGRRVDARQEHC